MGQMLVEVEFKVFYSVRKKFVRSVICKEVSYFFKI